MAENMKLYELYSQRREEYHSTRPSGQQNVEVPMNTLAEEWALEITKMGFADRTPDQIKQRIRDMRKFSGKHAHKLGITNMSAGNELERYAEFGWAEPKRHSRGPVPDWMSGLAEIMMSEQDTKQDDVDSASEIMKATYGPKIHICLTINQVNEEVAHVFVADLEKTCEEVARAGDQK